WEPFFTTKEEGAGTGFGLSTTYGIIKQNKGYIFCESEPGKGTKFFIYLPLYEGESAESSQLVDESSESEMTGVKGKKILFCEDDASVRKVISKMLTSSGFDIIEAVDGEDALVKFKENIDDICCVVSDNVTPKKSGVDLYEGIIEINPNIRFVMISGYSADTEKMTELQKNKNFRFLQKPIKPTLLKKTIMELTEESDD
ncbi:MAG TPA: hypothetical protein DHM44_08530, partial [Flexistipes sinusarabici]|nr:hypothetical protein [Flexistipes sinusarabici]